MNRKPPHARRAIEIRRASVVAFLAMAAVLSLSACSPKEDTDAPSPATANGDITLTAAQKAHIGLYTVALSLYRRTIESSGVVDFDNDQATSVLAPFSGPVSRLLVSPGDRVAKGQPLAIVESPDFATALSAYSKALATARNTRRLADMDKDLLQHSGISQREALQAETDALNAAADRDAALQSLVSLGVDPQSIRTLQQGRPISRIQGVIRSPIAFQSELNTALEPVKCKPAKFGCAIATSAARAPSPCTRLITPGGNPASMRSDMVRCAESA